MADRDIRPAAVVGELLDLTRFRQLAGTLGGYPYVKLVVDRDGPTIHFIDSADNPLHVRYIAEEILGVPTTELMRDIDAFNHDVLHRPDRRFYLGLLALHGTADGDVLSLETVEADTMDADLLRYFYGYVRDHVDASVPLVLKPANHLQEQQIADIPPAELPRLLAHELFSSASFVPLNPGATRGRLRVFRSEREYRDTANPVRWHDIIVMPRVPDDIPRLSGIINAEHTTPLSHTNILATGWGIPNAVRLGILDRPATSRLDGSWVDYRVEASGADVHLEPAATPTDLDVRPPWAEEPVTLAPPEVAATPIVALSDLRGDAHYRFGTKAANLGELCHVLAHGSSRWLGFYRVPRPPRDNLLGYLATQLGVADPADTDALSAAAARLLAEHTAVPRGIALPFSLQQRFLESSPAIQQAIGRLKMALEIGAVEVDPLCRDLQRLITTTRLPEDMRRMIDDAIVTHLSGVGRFVVRSSSNAEDLAGFSAAGVYESLRHVGTADTVVDAVREVWASMLSTRSVLLRQQAGIPLADSYMGVIVQEQVPASVGGVLVTCNPLNRKDFRNVYVNMSARSVTEVVEGGHAPLQHLYNTVEGGGRTLSLGAEETDVDAATKERLGRLALIGRLLQSHFSPDYTYATPVDIEWVLDGDRFQLLQLRPYRMPE
ncbi:phosphoenolpyruvate synthase [Solihabitans fulvus]|uniref:Phosphoenolpyruvate synthase n=1 Tax=Solihabitans fulvus TaxID=1892852 RepID=A0A5B2W7H5_9PSEU|nr:phosphoenolpyruvate synthase [Solihabitans fulvus]